MNNDTIKAAEDAEKMFAEDQIKQAFLAGAEYMQAQKDEQIKEMVDLLRFYRDMKAISPDFMELNEQQIQKYKG